MDVLNIDFHQVIADTVSEIKVMIYSPLPELLRLDVSGTGVTISAEQDAPSIF